MLISSDNKFVNKKYMDIAVKEFKSVFGGNVKLLKQEFSNDAAGMGAFNLKYLYINTGHIIEFDCQKLTFSITIYNNRGGEASIMGICQSVLKSEYGMNPWKDSEMTESNICRAIDELGIALFIKIKEIPFYIYKDDEVYLDLNGNISLITDYSTIII